MTKQQAHKEANRRFRAKRLASNQCVECDKPCLKGIARCQEHRNKHRKMIRDKYRKKHDIPLNWPTWNMIIEDMAK